jgi:hypothetical protein
MRTLVILLLLSTSALAQSAPGVISSSPMRWQMGPKDFPLLTKALSVLMEERTRLGDKEGLAHLEAMIPEAAGTQRPSGIQIPVFIQALSRIATPGSPYCELLQRLQPAGPATPTEPAHAAALCEGRAPPP